MTVLYRAGSGRAPLPPTMDLVPAVDAALERVEGMPSLRPSRSDVTGDIFSGGTLDRSQLHQEVLTSDVTAKVQRAAV